MFSYSFTAIPSSSVGPFDQKLCIKVRYSRKQALISTRNKQNTTKITPENKSYKITTSFYFILLALRLFVFFFLFLDFDLFPFKLAAFVFISHVLINKIKYKLLIIEFVCKMKTTRAPSQQQQQQKQEEMRITNTGHKKALKKNVNYF